MAGFKDHVLEHGNEILTSGYGERTLDGRTYFHHAVDVVSGLKGTDGHKLADRTIAIEAGKVIATAYDASRGYYVRIQHTPHLVSHYQHLKKGSFLVKVGETVKKGQPLATIGFTGDCQYSDYRGRHLDFQIIIDGERVNPLPYLTGVTPILPSAPVSVNHSFNVKVSAVWVNYRLAANGVATGKKAKYGEVLKITEIKRDEQGREWGHTGGGWVALWLTKKI